MKLSLLVLLLSIGAALAFSARGRGRRNGNTRDPDVTAMNCIFQECSNDMMKLSVRFNDLAERFKEALLGPEAMLRNLTGDESQLKEHCEEMDKVLECPKQKCTLTENVRALVDMYHFFDYLCQHTADIVRHSSCLIDMFFVDGPVRREVQNCVAGLHSTFVPMIGGRAPLPTPSRPVETHRRLRRFIFPVFTESPFPLIRRSLADLPQVSCTELMTGMDCVLTPARTNCGVEAATLMLAAVKDALEHVEKFAKKVAPDVNFPDIDKCEKERDDAALAFFKYLFF